MNCTDITLMFLPSEDILKNLYKIIHPYALVFAGTFAPKNILTCMSVTPVRNFLFYFLTSNTSIGNNVLKAGKLTCVPPTSESIP